MSQTEWPLSPPSGSLRRYLLVLHGQYAHSEALLARPNVRPGARTVFILRTRLRCSPLHMSQIPSTHAAFDCSYRPDKFFDDGCSRHFWSCASGVAMKLECASGLFFDEIKQRCDFKMHVPVCGGARPRTVSMVKTPPLRARDPGMPASHSHTSCLQSSSTA